MLILTLRAAKHGARPACDKGFRAVPAKADRIFAVDQHKAEHHLHSQKHGMEIPDNGMIIHKSDMIGGYIAAKGRYALLHQPTGILA